MMRSAAGRAAIQQDTNDQARQGLYRRYPTSEALLATAIARTHSGD